MDPKLHFTILGACPSKKNSKQAMVVRGRMLILTSKRYKEWHKTASQELVLACRGIEKLQALKHVTMEFYWNDKRLFDLSNKVESICDLMVDVGLIADDNYMVIPELTARFGGVDKLNPRCEVTLTLNS